MQSACRRVCIAECTVSCSIICSWPILEMIIVCHFLGLMSYKIPTDSSVQFGILHFLRDFGRATLCHTSCKQRLHLFMRAATITVNRLAAWTRRFVTFASVRMTSLCQLPIYFGMFHIQYNIPKGTKRRLRCLGKMVVFVEEHCFVRVHQYCTRISCSWEGHSRTSGFPRFAPLAERIKGSDQCGSHG